MSILSRVCRPRHLHVVLRSDEPQPIPERGEVALAWYATSPSMVHYHVQSVRLEVWAEHDCPSDAEIHVSGPLDSHAVAYYRSDVPDWSLNVVADLTASFRHLPLKGLWVLRIRDTIAGDGGHLQDARLVITARDPLGLNPATARHDIACGGTTDKTAVTTARQSKHRRRPSTRK